MRRDVPTGGAADVPPPGGALMSALAAMKPVRTRVPFRALLAMIGLASVVPLIMVIGAGPRKDLAALPIAWVVAMGSAWASAAGLCFAAAILPPRGEVMPSATRAGRAAWLAAAGMVLLGVFATVDAAGETVVPAEAFGRTTWHCLRVGLEVSVPVLMVGLLLLRRAVPSGGARIAAALGAAGGALGGLTLHFICGYGGALHVGIAHAGGVVVGALLGALILPRFLRGW